MLDVILSVASVPRFDDLVGREGGGVEIPGPLFHMVVAFIVHVRGAMPFT